MKKKLHKYEHPEYFTDMLWLVIPMTFHMYMTCSLKAWSLELVNKESFFLNGQLVISCVMHFHMQIYSFITCQGRSELFMLLFMKHRGSVESLERLIASVLAV